MIIGKINEGVDYQNIDIDLKGIKTKKELLNKVAKELNFPAIEENSWDAFCDWFGVLYEPFNTFNAVKITFKNCGGLEESVKKMFISILKNPEYEYFVCDDISNKHVPCYYEILD